MKRKSMDVMTRTAKHKSITNEVIDNVMCVVSVRATVMTTVMKSDQRDNGGNMMMPLNTSGNIHV